MTARLTDADLAAMSASSLDAVTRHDIRSLLDDLCSARTALKRARRVVVTAIRTNVDLPDFAPEDTNIIKLIDAALPTEGTKP